jgi:quinol monooxygenase YgiN
MTVFYAVMVEVDQKEEATWNDWHIHQHIPDVLAQPGFVRATKYLLDASNGDWHQYLTVYELTSRDALDAYLQGEAVTQLRADHYNHFGHCTRLSRMILTPTAVVVKPIG